MSSRHPTQAAGDKIKKAIRLLSELKELNPEKSQRAILEEVEKQFDLSPLECEFLNKHFSASEK